MALMVGFAKSSLANSADPGSNLLAGRKLELKR
jgi:hypothetical protein